MGNAEIELLRSIALRLGTLASYRAKGKIESSTLREAMQLIVGQVAGLKGIEARLYIPHYWAVYYHDGRKGFEAKDGTFLVFFADPKDDPRLANGYPERASDVRKLTAQEFRRGLEINASRAASGASPFMYVLKSVKRAKKHPFFEKGMVGFDKKADPIVFELVDAFMQQLLDDVGPDKGTATFRF